MAGLSLANISPYYRETQRQQQPQPYQQPAPAPAPPQQQTSYQSRYSAGSYRPAQPPPTQVSPYASPWDPKMTQGLNDRLIGFLSQDPNRVSRTDSDVAPLIQTMDAVAQRNARMARQAAAERAAAEGTLQSGNFSAEVGQINDLYHQRQAGMEAQVLNDSLQQRRAQIMQALQIGSGLIDNDTERRLKKELADMQNQQFYSDLGLRADLGFGQLDLGNRGLDLQTELGRGDLGLRGRQLDQQNSQFYDRLGFDQAAFEGQMNSQIINQLLGF